MIRRILEESGYADNPYFAALNDGSFEKDDFVETQVQFYFAVDFFSRPMAAVAARIPRRIAGWRCCATSGRSTARATRR